MSVTLTGRYLYAVSRGIGPQDVADLFGLQAACLELVEYRGLVAVVSDVPLSEFGEEGLRRNLEDIDWLETAVRRHDAVIQAISARAATAPMRLATICFDDDGVRARLREWYVALQQLLDRVDGRSEWSVKAFAAPAQVREPVAAGAVSGAEYLRRKQAELEHRGQSIEESQAAAADLHDALAARAVAHRLLSHQDPRFTGHEGAMVLNAAYLVPDADLAAFEAAVADVAARHPGLEVDSRGPWAPYSFAMLDQR